MFSHLSLVLLTFTTASFSNAAVLKHAVREFQRDDFIGTFTRIRPTEQVEYCPNAIQQSAIIDPASGTNFLLPHLNIQHDGEACTSNGSTEINLVSDLQDASDIDKVLPIEISGELQAISTDLNVSPAMLIQFASYYGVDPSRRRCGSAVGFPENTVYFYVNEDTGTSFGQSLDSLQASMRYILVIGMQTASSPLFGCVYMAPPRNLDTTSTDTSSSEPSPGGTIAMPDANPQGSAEVTGGPAVMPDGGNGSDGSPGTEDSVIPPSATEDEMADGTEDPVPSPDAAEDEIADGTEDPAVSPDATEDETIDGTDDPAASPDATEDEMTDSTENPAVSPDVAEEETADGNAEPGELPNTGESEYPETSPEGETGSVPEEGGETEQTPENPTDDSPGEMDQAPATPPEEEQGTDDPMSDNGDDTPAATEDPVEEDAVVLVV